MVKKKNKEKFSRPSRLYRNIDITLYKQIFQFIA